MRIGGRGLRRLSPIDRGGRKSQLSGGAVAAWMPLSRLHCNRHRADNSEHKIILSGLRRGNTILTLIVARVPPCE
jgi:hypothetical protein